MATTARDGAEDEAGHGRPHHDAAGREEKAARRRRNLGGGRLLGFGAGIRPRYDAHMTSALMGEGVSQILTRGREVARIWY